MRLNQLSDKELHLKINNLVQNERELLTQILHHLAEIERRRSFSTHKCSSLFEYATKILGYSESQAHRRITAMRMIREVPEVEKKIEDGKLTLTNVAEARRFFRQEEKATKVTFSAEEKKIVLEKLENKSTREGERTLLQMSSAPVQAKESTRAVTDELTEIKLIADSDLLEKLEKVRGLLAHKNPNPSHGELLSMLCDITIEKLEPKAPTEKDKEKAAKTTAQKVSPRQTNRRRPVAASVKRVVYHRDQGCCTQCRSKYALEMDHIRPVSLGGGNEALNLRLLCRSCNQRAAIEKLGVEKMQTYFHQG